MAKKQSEVTAPEVTDPEVTAPEVIKARVLMDCAYGKVDDVIEILPEDLATAEQSGQVDTHPDAVAYAESLK